MECECAKGEREDRMCNKILVAGEEEDEHIRVLTECAQYGVYLLRNCFHL